MFRIRYTACIQPQYLVLVSICEGVESVSAHSSVRAREREGAFIGKWGDSRCLEDLRLDLVYMSGLGNLQLEVELFYMRNSPDATLAFGSHPGCQSLHHT